MTYWEEQQSYHYPKYSMETNQSLIPRDEKEVVTDCVFSGTSKFYLKNCGFTTDQTCINET